MNSLTGLAADLHQYLQQSRDALVRAQDGLSDYDARRPLTPSGTNILGLIKHVAGVEAGYLGGCLGRPFPVVLPWEEDKSIWEGADMWTLPGESRSYIIDLYRQAWAHSDAALAELPLDAPAHVGWWQEGQRDTTFGHLLVRVVAETAQHAGHVEIVRENLDGQGSPDQEDIGDDGHWKSYVSRIQSAADTFRLPGE